MEYPEGPGPAPTRCFPEEESLRGEQISKSVANNKREKRSSQMLAMHFNLVYYSLTAFGDDLREYIKKIN